MNFILRQKAVALAEWLHLRIFGHEMSDKMREFLGHLSWSFFGGIIAAGIMFALNILAGRWLGPEEYGKYGLVIAIASIFVIPMVFGVDTAVTHYIAKTKETREKEVYIKSSLWVVVFNVLLWTTVLLALYPLIVRAFSISKPVFYFALVFSVILGLRNIADSCLRGYHLFESQSKIRVFEAVAILGFFLYLVKYLNFLDFRSYASAILAGYLLAIVVVCYKFKKSLLPSGVYSKKIIRYGFYALWGSVSGIMISSLDKILVGKYLNNELLGIYNAYATMSLLVVGQVVALFVNVFFPFLSSFSESAGVLKKINKLSAYLFIPAFFLISSIIFLGIKLFGNKYPVNWLLITEFGLYGALYAYFSVLWWLIASKSGKGMWFTSKNGMISGILFLALVMLFGGGLSLHFVVLFLIIAIIYNILVGNLFYARIK